jgi:hypothetical protein
MFAIVLPRVLPAENRPFKNQGCIPEIHAALFDVAKPLRFVPIHFKRHLRLLPVIRVWASCMVSSWERFISSTIVLDIHKRVHLPRWLHRRRIGRAKPCRSGFRSIRAAGLGSAGRPAFTIVASTRSSASSSSAHKQQRPAGANLPPCFVFLSCILQSGLPRSCRAQQDAHGLFMYSPQ